MRAVRRAWALAFLMAATVIPASPGMADAHVFFSELHYDNTGTDTGEAIEVTAPAGMDMSDWSIVLYNGNGGAPYDTTNLVGTVPGAGAFTVSYPSNGIQNGSPDGMALVDASGAVVQFLSYEGTLTAVGGPADGMTSIDIGVEEPGDTPIGESLKATAIDAVWTGPSAADFAPALIPPAVDSDVFFSELHYDNTGTDTGEAIEVTAPAGMDMSGWSIVLYNGSNGTVYNTRNLVGTVPGAGAFTESFPSIQNGSPDGMALVDASGAVVQFMSYEGTFTAVGGPADGMTSVDIGVEEPFDTPVGQSLKSTAIDASWTGPSPADFAPELIPPSPIFLSELHYDNAGGDTGEFFEIQGPAGTDLDGWSVVFYNGNGGGAYATENLEGVIDDEADGEGAVAFPRSGIQNGSPDGLALVNPDGQAVEFLSYEGSFTAIGGPADGLTSTDIGVEEPSNTPTGQSLQRIVDTWRGPFEASADDLNALRISVVQGSDAASALAGDRVVVEGIVVGDFETFDHLAGFFVQEEDADADADSETSEGVFVFNHANDDVAAGDLVRVEGTVEERFGNTQLTDFVDVVVLSSGNTLPSAATVEFPLDSPSDLEAYEGMLATLPQKLTILEYFNFDRFGEVVVGIPLDGQDRLHQPTAVFDPGTPESFALADYNATAQITIDDGRTSQNPDPAIHPGNGLEFDLDNRFRGGDIITGVTGPIYYDFDLYRVMPTSYGTFEQVTTRPDAPEDVGGDLKVAAFNALNYFLTIDDGSDNCGPDRDLECRGADNEEERLRQRAKLLAAIEGLDADVVGLIEVENSPGVEPLADLVDGLNERLGRNTYRYVAAGENSVVGTDAIKVGLIYKPANVQPIGETAILDDPSFLDPNDLGEDKNRAAVAQAFVEKGTGERFTVVVNHLKSKGSPCGSGDDDPQAGSCNLTRTLAVQALLDWLDTTPTDVDDPDVLIIGDLNSYDMEDPIDALLAAGYADLLKDYQGDLAYSYLFSAQLGYLDYGMSSESLTSQVTGATVWHINADEPDILDYDTSFKQDAQDALYESNAYRSSDHDPVLIGLDLASKPGRGLGRR